MSDVTTAEKEAPKEEPAVTQAPVAAKPRPHRATRPAAAARPAPAPRAAASTSHLAPKKGFIRLLCVQDYSHGHRLQIPPKMIKDTEGYSDFAPADIRKAVTQYVAGEEYYLESSQAARLLRDKGPARYKNPLTDRVERRKEGDIYFRAVDRAELDAWLDKEIDAIEARRDTPDDVEVNDQNASDEEDDE